MAAINARMRQQDIPELIIDGLATYRLTRLVVKDHMPILRVLRNRSGEWLDGQLGPGWGALVSCAWCVGIYVAGLASVAKVVTPRLWRVIAETLAISTVAGLLGELS